METDQLVKILDVVLAASNTISRANGLLARARAGEEITDADIDALVAESDAKRRAFNEAQPNG